MNKELNRLIYKRVNYKNEKSTMFKPCSNQKQKSLTETSIRL